MAVDVPETSPGERDVADVAGFLAGDANAFERLVSRHERCVYLLSHRMLGDREEALDATQEVFLRCFRALASFRGEASFRTWLLGIAVNHCRSRLTSAAARSRRRSVSLDVSDEDGSATRLPVVKDLSPDPESSAFGGELRVALSRALVGLSPEHREVLLLREAHGLDYGELSRVLGCALGTVKSRLARARGALRQALEGVWP